MEPRSKNKRFLWVWATGLLFIGAFSSGAAQRIESWPQTPALEVGQVVDSLSDKVSFVNSPAWLNFIGQFGQSWTVSLDRRSGVPALVHGAGIPWVSRDDLPSLDSLDHTARQFLSDHNDLFKVEPGSLILNREVSSNLGERQELWNLIYQYYHEAVPVLGAKVVFRINHGRLIQFGAEKVSPISLSTVPALGRDIAYLSVLRMMGILPTDPMTLFDAGTLYILPIAAEAELRDPTSPPTAYNGPPGNGYHHRLIYQFILQVPNDDGTYVVRLDAHSGEIVDFFDDTKYGQVNGGVYLLSISDGKEVVLPFPYASITNGRIKFSDRGGYYNYEGGPATTALSGQYVTLFDYCGAPNLSVSAPPGDLPFGTNLGTDCDVNETSHTTKAARNVFYHINVTRQLAAVYLLGQPRARSWLDATVRANVNGSTMICNANFNGRVNFFLSGLFCNNSGEIADVIQHEWGHGLDYYSKPTADVGDSAKGEAVADINALLSAHDACAAPDFFWLRMGETRSCPTALRDLDFGMTQENIEQFCRRDLRCRGALGYECHCESHILSGAIFDLARRLVARYGVNEGWRVLERLFYLALPNLTQYLPETTGSAYSAFLAAADDNGNLDDGVPDGDLIFAAFDRAGIAGPALPNFHATCTNRPAAPFAEVQKRDQQVIITWPTVPGARSYNVVRRVSGVGSKAYLPLASQLTETFYIDSEVSRDIDYDYIVVVHDGSCASRYGYESSTAVSSRGSRERTSIRPPFRFR
ncbi:MAG: hypothetical protein HYR55_13540 [Acidobacteria bacterium]|nr:hypothetical protein [Acidobacteriota bacterium]MBI3658154.1 hypothetical protein [Acidobacteriota bacterium]